ncbi:UvrD-helicase domain-containing protein [Gemella massiliensis]|uniref:UvrD-helicase domain-containing protein n=1 Tax=Gemella massiliensis TaxID=1909670 RepID=UPI0009311ED2|nr:UvrD-helicase domain-containing protein [Gemella massiliensis]
MIKIDKIDKFTLNKKYPPTPAQWQAIGIDGADILVAAAAGSGKTEVLSERISRKVATDRWDIDKILVLTFTTAAAKNMKVRIENKIADRLLSFDNEEALHFLRKQRMLMNDALITTIDSFCLSVLRKFYYLVEENIDGEMIYLSPNFNVLPNSKTLLTQVINTVLENTVEISPKLTDILFTVFNGKKDIVASLQDTYYKLLTIPNFENYLEKEFLININSTVKNFDESVLSEFNLLTDLTTNNSLQTARQFTKYLESFIENDKNIRRIEDIVISVDLNNVKKEKIFNFFSGDIEQETIFGSRIENKTKLKKIVNILDENIFLMQDTKQINAQLLETTFLELKSYSEKFNILRSIKDFACSYQKILRTIHFEFVKTKRKSNFLDFSDLNHLAIKALTKKENGKMILTAAAKYYQKYFLEIYVDEYQDNNNLQEYILNIIRGENVYFFRVGDVKQAIYGFRGSNPDLFEEKYNSYEKLNIEDYSMEKEYHLKTTKTGICVMLKENFRSEVNVLSSCNYIFNRLMKNFNAGISYDKENALYYPAVKEKTKLTIPTKIINGKIDYFSGQEIENKKGYREQSIKNIAFEILNGVEQGNNYSDYAILVRNSTKMASFKEIFSSYNIPLFFKEKDGFTSSNTFNILYNIFKFLDNTNRDSSLVAILRSELFSYTNDELLKLSLNNEKTFYKKLKISDEVKDRHTINILNSWLNYSLNNSIRTILEKIVIDTDFINYLRTVDINDEEVDYYENFLDVVYEYENVNNNLSDFIVYLENIREQEKFETKKRVSNNSVTLSTIHISKGLEYKYVFIADLDTDFNNQGFSGEVLFTSEFGFSVDVENIATKHNYEYQSVFPVKLYKLNAQLIKLREREEEIRNLYVALTRAEKGLYLVSPNGIMLNDEEKKQISVTGSVFEAVNFEEILSVVLSNYNNEDRAENELTAEFEYYEPNQNKKVFSVENEREVNFVEIYKELEVENKDKLIKQKTNKIFPAKTSYSAMKKINKDKDEIIKKDNKEINYLELSNLNKITTATKALQRGNIIHKLFERIVQSVFEKEEIIDVQSYVENLVRTDNIIYNIKNKTLLTKEEYNLINNEDDLTKVKMFLESEVISFVKDADTCETELSFTTLKKAKELYNESESNIEVILQGVVDLLINIDGQYLIIDYKTDNVSKKNGESILEKRHGEQLKIYKEAVKKYYNCTEVKTYIYSYTLSKLIEV